MEIRPKEPISSERQAETFYFGPKIAIRGVEQLQVINVKTLGSAEEELELSYYVKLKDEEENTDFTRALQGMNGVEHINLFFDEEQF